LGNCEGAKIIADFWPAAPKELTLVTTTTRIIPFEHVIIRSAKGFAEVRATLEHSLPKLNPEITALIASGGTKRLQEDLEAGPELAIFLSRDHGSLLRKTRQTRARLCSTTLGTHLLHPE